MSCGVARSGNRKTCSSLSRHAHLEFCHPQLVGPISPRNARSTRRTKSATVPASEAQSRPHSVSERTPNSPPSNGETQRSPRMPDLQESESPAGESQQSVVPLAQDHTVSSTPSCRRDRSVADSGSRRILTAQSITGPLPSNRRPLASRVIGTTPR